MFSIFLFKKKLIFLNSITISILMGLSSNIQAQLPLAIQVQHTDYKMDPQFYLDVINDRQLELWDRAY